jgi:Tektin family
MDNMMSEIESLTKSKCCLERALGEIENILYISQECLYNREKRQGIDQVHDDVEESLILVI